MKASKKILSIIVAVAMLAVMVTAAVSFSSIADEKAPLVSDANYPAYRAGTFAFTLGGEKTVKPGETFTVELGLENNPGIQSWSTAIKWDSDVLEPVLNANGKCEPEMAALQFTTDEAPVQTASDGYKFFNYNGYGIQTKKNYTASGTQFTMQFKVKENAARGTTKLVWAMPQTTTGSGEVKVIDKDANDIPATFQEAVINIDAETEKPTETEAPTETEKPTETEAPTEKPTEKPTETEAPTEKPTEKPTETEAPTEKPTEKPTETEAPTEKPTEKPTETEAPTEKPTEKPTETEAPTEKPTEKPTETEAPTEKPTVTEAPTETQAPAPSETETPVETETDAPTETQAPTESETPADNGNVPTGVAAPIAAFITAAGAAFVVFKSRKK